MFTRSSGRLYLASALGTLGASLFDSGRACDRFARSWIILLWSRCRLCRERIKSTEQEEWLWTDEECLTSEQFYEGRLSSRDGRKCQVIRGGSVFPESGLVFCPVPHEGNQNQIHISQTDHRPHDVEEVLDAVDVALRRMSPKAAFFVTLCEIENRLSQIVRLGLGFDQPVGSRVESERVADLNSKLP